MQISPVPSFGLDPAIPEVNQDRKLLTEHISETKTLKPETL